MKKLLLCIMVFCSLIMFSQDEKATDSIKKPFQLSGSLTLFASVYEADGIEARRKSFSWFLSGTPVMSIHGFDVPLSFIVSEQERDFRQPFNQFGIAPKYKWVQGYLGYSNIQWSPFTWAGQTILGAGVELTPNKLRVGFLYGRMNRAVEENINPVEFQTPAFRRNGYAAKIGYGTQTSYVDLIFLKGKDDINSLKKIPENQVVLPAENIVLGISSQVKLSKRLFWNADVASSLFTRDIRSTYEDSEEGTFLENFESFITVNSSSQLSNSFQTAIRLDYEKFKMKARYRRIDPDYQSMGAYFFQTDIQNITLEPTVILFKNKLRLTSSIGHQRDNLLNKKSVTTNRWIGSAAFDWTLNKTFGLVFNYSNYSTDEARGLKIPNQVTQQSFVNQNMMIMPRAVFVKKNLTQVHTVVFNKQWLVDNNLNTSEFTEYDVNNITYNNNFIFNITGLNLGTSIMYSNFESEANTNKLIGIGGNLSKSFWKNRLTNTLYFNFTDQKLNNENFAKIFNINLQSMIKIDNHNGFTINGIFLNNNSSHPEGINFKEYNFDIGYTYTF